MTPAAVSQCPMNDFTAPSMRGAAGTPPFLPPRRLPCTATVV
jgi:hypothetical protein